MQISIPGFTHRKRYYLIEMVWFFLFFLEEFISEVYEIN